MQVDATVRPLEASDAEALSALLRAQPEGYMKHFHPFSFDEASVRRQIASAVRDRFWALEHEGTLAGFFMLRGFDAGYERPSFGVFVAAAHQGHGLATAALEFAKQWSRENSVARVMLKVAPENKAAQAVYSRAGFAPVGPCPDTGHVICEWRSDS